MRLEERLDRSDNSSRGKSLHSVAPHKSSSIGEKLGNGLLHRRESKTRSRLHDSRRLGIISSWKRNSVQDNHDQEMNWAVAEGGNPETSSFSSVRIASTQASLPSSCSTPLLTPPEDAAAWKWATSISPRQRSIAKIPTISPGATSDLVITKSPVAPSAEDNASAERAPSQLTPSRGAEGHQDTTKSTTPDSSLDAGDTSSWIEQSIQATVTIDPADPYSSTLQIVSQTLPSPAKENSKPNALFNDVIGAIQSDFGAVRQPYITITHAVPPRFELLNLPGSPPSTPNLSVGGDDYFSQYVFAHAAVVPPHHINSSVTIPALCSPNPIVPPSSVHISVLERYIPPSSPQECKELFSLTGQSALVDRLAELSPAGGSMLFAYPTKTGGQVFTSQHLSPILDPLLRSLVEVHQLSYGLAESLSNMAGVPGLLGYESLRGKMEALCGRLSRHHMASGTRRSRFHLVYAGKGDIAIDRRTWTEWYLKQEHPRFKRTLDTYWGCGKRLSQVESATAGTVLREFVDGVNKMTIEEAEQTGAGVEIAVFVIRRTLVAPST